MLGALWGALRAVQVVFWFPATILTAFVQRATGDTLQLKWFLWEYLLWSTVVETAASASGQATRLWWLDRFDWGPFQQHVVSQILCMVFARRGGREAWRLVGERATTRWTAQLGRPPASLSRRTRVTHAGRFEDVATWGRIRRPALISDSHINMRRLSSVQQKNRPCSEFWVGSVLNGNFPYFWTNPNLPATAQCIGHAECIASLLKEPRVGLGAVVRAPIDLLI